MARILSHLKSILSFFDADIKEEFLLHLPPLIQITAEEIFQVIDGFMKDIATTSTMEPPVFVGLQGV